MSSLLIAIDTVPASDGWGFVGRVLIGDIEAYRTIRAYTTPSEALHATTDLMAGVLGPCWPGRNGTRPMTKQVMRPFVPSWGSV